MRICPDKECGRLSRVVCIAVLLLIVGCEWRGPSTAFLQNDNFVLEGENRDCMTHFHMQGEFEAVVKGGSFRCELREVEPNFSVGYVNLSFEVMLPKKIEKVADAHNLIFMQFHARRDFEAGELFRRPPVALLVNSAGGYLYVRTDENPITLGHDGVTFLSFKLPYELTDFARGVAFQLELKWGKDGYLNLSSNDVSLVKMEGIFLGYNDSRMPYFKAGIYDTSRQGVYADIPVRLANIKLEMCDKNSDNCATY